MSSLDEQVELLARELPDAEGARLFYRRLTGEHPRVVQLFARDAGLLSDALALSAWSPLLGTTLAQNPEYLTWMVRERAHAGVRTTEQFGEALARFHLTNSRLDHQVLLARFRRRELLRIYLRDIRRTSTLVELTEELSNLADAVLEHALSLARQDLDNLYGQPQCVDERGRTAAAGLCIVALGKLGSHELNYASDIDLLFLYSDDGLTAGTGARGQITNREYFVKLAETIVRIIGRPGGEGAPYRVDLRLRPYGRDGMLASSLAEAVRYYREKAQAWELQALIRSRAAAGSAAIYARFAERVRPLVYRTDETVSHALALVRAAKGKIDRHHRQDTGGFNVKLGRGGIREIEFIAQALQLAFGGQDAWLRPAHTLISLGRLADRKLITERERAELSAAYEFLRTLEHRVQMEHGLQTHSVPTEEGRRLLLARRMGFAGQDPLAAFDAELETQTANVRSAYERVFAGAEGQPPASPPDPVVPPAATPLPARVAEEILDADTADLMNAARMFRAHIRELRPEKEGPATADVAGRLRAAAEASLNPRRALRLAARVAASLDKSSAETTLLWERLPALVRLCGGSEFFGDLLASSPALISALPPVGDAGPERDYRAHLCAVVEAGESFPAQLAALRRAWAKLLVEIGALDIAAQITMQESNRRQTLLAAASLDAGCLLARHELERRLGGLDTEPRLAVLGLGRLGGGGMDYNSDLDVVLIYDDASPSPVARLTPPEAYGRFAELLIEALSSLTRDGYLYRVDLRLRPDGANGPTSSGRRAFAEYLEERSAPWEWLAYVKVRAAAGDRELGLKAEAEARSIVHRRAQQADRGALRAETRRVRERLEREKTKSSRPALDIKFGPGGMLDVYFATRYLQLREGVPDRGADRSTRETLARLRAAGAMAEPDYVAMSEGYAFLRVLDHHLRLIVGRSTRLPGVGHPALDDLRRRLGFDSTAKLKARLGEHMKAIRAAYDRITLAEGNS